MNSHEKGLLAAIRRLIEVDGFGSKQPDGQLLVTVNPNDKTYARSLAELDKLGAIIINEATIPTSREEESEPYTLLVVLTKGFWAMQANLQAKALNQFDGPESRQEGAKQGDDAGPGFVSYNASTGLLEIAGRHVRLRTDSGTRGYIARLLLKSRSAMRQDWAYNEVYQLINGQETTGSDKELRNIYYAALRLNKEIGEHTGIKDLFAITTKSIRVNTKYIPRK